MFADVGVDAQLSELEDEEGRLEPFQCQHHLWTERKRSGVRKHGCVLVG